MRLNKYIAHCGVSSRRKADELIEKGLVKVNGTVAVVGLDVSEDDTVEVDGRVIKPEKKLVYYLLNKPAGYITSSNDDKNRDTVLKLMPDVSARIYSVGRLDFNTTGMLIMTNDGELAYKLTHPSSHIFKTYRVAVAGMLTAADARRLEKGVDIGEHITAPAGVEIISQSESRSVAEIRITEGKNRQVRRMFEAVGHRVIELDRIAIGNMKLAHLRRGQYRKLSQNEINYLKSL